MAFHRAPEIKNHHKSGIITWQIKRSCKYTWPCSKLQTGAKWEIKSHHMVDQTIDQEPWMVDQELREVDQEGFIAFLLARLLSQCWRLCMWCHLYLWPPHTTSKSQVEGLGRGVPYHKGRRCHIYQTELGDSIQHHATQYMTDPWSFPQEPPNRPQKQPQPSRALWKLFWSNYLARICLVMSTIWLKITTRLTWIVSEWLQASLSGFRNFWEVPGLTPPLSTLTFQENSTYINKLPRKIQEKCAETVLGQVHENRVFVLCCLSFLFLALISLLGEMSKSACTTMGFIIITVSYLISEH